MGENIIKVWQKSNSSHTLREESSCRQLFPAFELLTFGVTSFVSMHHDEKQEKGIFPLFEKHVASSKKAHHDGTTKQLQLTASK